MNDLCIVIIGGRASKRRCGLPAHRQHVCVVHWWALNDRKKEKPDVQPTAAQ